MTVKIYLFFFLFVSNLFIRSCIWPPLCSLNKERLFNISKDFSTSPALGATNSSLSSSSISSTTSSSIFVASSKIYSSVSVDSLVITASSALARSSAVILSGTRLESFPRNSCGSSLISLKRSSSSLIAIV